MGPHVIHRTTDITTNDMATTYQIDGMHCASCAVKIEKALGGVPGVTTASVNFATETARVEGTATLEDLNGAVRRVGKYELLPTDER